MTSEGVKNDKKISKHFSTKNKRRTCKHSINHAFVKVDFNSVYDVDFTFYLLSFEQHTQQGNRLHDYRQ